MPKNSTLEWLGGANNTGWKVPCKPCKQNGLGMGNLSTGPVSSGFMTPGSLPDALGVCLESH
ncbi:hypothetical protein N7540_013210 [Penicillium herquei]|nr:hypothetical protein N7540_013210 [Penicillium herquei]